MVFFKLHLFVVSWSVDRTMNNYDCGSYSCRRNQICLSSAGSEDVGVMNWALEAVAYDVDASGNADAKTRG